MAFPNLALIFTILWRLGYSSCCYCKKRIIGFEKLADLFFEEGYMTSINSSLTLKIPFIYILLGVVPIVFTITISVPSFQ